MSFSLNKKKGLSGCKLQLLSDEKIVRKISSNNDYNTRLELQMEKQISFKKNNGIETPKVYSFGVEDDLFYFDMEYITGQDIMDIFLSGNENDINNFYNYIILYFNNIISNSKKKIISYLKKSNLDKLNSLKKNSKYKLFIDYIIYENQMNDSEYFLESDCHGDFTLSNMIYFNSNIYLLDFLDSYVNTPIIDIVKIKQDLYYHWSLNMLDKYNDTEIYKIKQVSMFIWDKISKNYIDLIETKDFKIIESINFLRIEPYIKDEMKLLLDESIKKLDLYEEFNNTNGWKI